MADDQSIFITSGTQAATLRALENRSFFQRGFPSSYGTPNDAIRISRGHERDIISREPNRSFVRSTPLPIVNDPFRKNYLVVGPQDPNQLQPAEPFLFGRGVDIVFGTPYPSLWLAWGPEREIIERKYPFVWLWASQPQISETPGPQRQLVVGPQEPELALDIRSTAWIPFFPITTDNNQRMIVVGPQEPALSEINRTWYWPGLVQQPDIPNPHRYLIGGPSVPEWIEINRTWLQSTPPLAQLPSVENVFSLGALLRQEQPPESSSGYAHFLRGTPPVSTGIPLRLLEVEVLIADSLENEVKVSDQLDAIVRINDQLDVEGEVTIWPTDEYHAGKQ